MIINLLILSAFSEWLKVEDILASVYGSKCGQEQGDEIVPAGQKYKRSEKVIIGGSLIILVVVLIWFPLALFALGSVVGESNIPFDVSVSLRIGPYEPVYEMSAQEINIIKLSQKWDRFQRPYLKNRTAETFLSNYDPEDVVAVILRANSSSTWNISPPDKRQLIRDLRSSMKTK